MDPLLKERLEFANKLIFVKQYDEAGRVLKDLTEACQEPLVHLRQIELMSLLGRLEELKQTYLSSQIEDAGFSQICVAMVDVFMSPDHAVKNIERLQQIMQLSGATPLVQFGIGFASEQQGNLERARLGYEQSIALDPQWYPSLFGLSQVYYNMGDEQKGDQYFHQFELLAPYNVYGNFETHRRLSRDFLQTGRSADAEKAIQMLTSWWVENKGFAPIEIQVYEQLAVAEIRDTLEQFEESKSRRERAKILTQEILEKSIPDENALYFVARVLSEYGEETAAFEVYKKVLEVAGNNPSVVQKVGSHFLGTGSFDKAKKLFEAAYKQHPNNPEIRFCLLVSSLKGAGVNVEEYLIGRERIRQLADGGDRVEFLSLLNALLARYQDDWDVHFHLGDLFARMGHTQKAAHHFAKMYELDPLGQSSRLRYANFLMSHDEPDLAMEVLEKITPPPQGSMTDHDAEIQWLKSMYFDRKQDWTGSMEMLRPILSRDPWNITYLVHQIICLTGIRDGAGAVQSAQENWARKIQNNEEARVNWQEFHKDTVFLSDQHQHELAYARAKLQFLYTRGSEHSLKSVVREACRYDASQGAKELLRLLNTNFDHPSVYWGLGLLYKELWQLEVSSMWLELTLTQAVAHDRLLALVYIDLADCYIWRNANMSKAVEYLKLSMDLTSKLGGPDRRALLSMGHALLLQGQVRQAKIYLDQIKDQMSDYEVQYLLGLVQYRNGHPLRANEIWKPLLKFKTEQMRDYRIKQEILRYYFEKTPYKPRDISKAN